jgi:hypothetical protein
MGLGQSAESDGAWPVDSGADEEDQSRARLLITQPSMHPSRQHAPMLWQVSSVAVESPKDFGRSGSESRDSSETPLTLVRARSRRRALAASPQRRKRMRIVRTPDHHGWVSKTCLANWEQDSPPFLTRWAQAKPLWGETTRRYQSIQKIEASRSDESTTCTSMTVMSH